VKENDIQVDYKPHQVLLYVEKNDGSYGPLQTGAFATKNYLSDFIEKRQHIIKDGIDKLKKGEISPVGYYLELYHMTVSDLAARASVSVGSVKKHLTAAGFTKAPLNVIRRYAEVFNIPVANLFQMIVPKNETLSITPQKTVNPYLTFLEIS
jgi:hypothetical protein